MGANPGGAALHRSPLVLTHPAPDACVLATLDCPLQARLDHRATKSGADAENVRQQIMKVLSDASLTVESIHFTEVELKDYVKAASAAEKPAPPPPKKVKAVRHTKARRKE